MSEPRDVFLVIQVVCSVIILAANILTLVYLRKIAKGEKQ